MPRENHQKIKLLKLMELLRRETDAQHPLTKTEICRRLNEMHITCDPRTLAKDVALLRQEGYDIQSAQIGHDRCYYVENRSFDIPELKILIDAVQAASFITEDKSVELINKLASLGSNYRASILKGNHIAFNTRKHCNEEIYHNVETLDSAICKNRKVSFFYFDLNENHQRIYRKEGARYTAEPLALVYHEDNYYLMGYNTDPDKPGDTVTYRVDRMDEVAVEANKICEDAHEQRKKLKGYTSRVFKMFGGPEEKVTLEFDDELIGAIYDKFGEEIQIKRINKHTCTVTTKVQVSPTFYGWVYQFGKKMRVI